MSMRVSDSFRDFVLDRLSEVDHLHARAMFGGVGLYAEDTFFGIVAADVLYFKVDDTNRRDYEAAGARAFKPYADRPITMSYYNVPVDVLEDSAMLAEWARRSIGVAKAVKPSRPKAGRPRKRSR